MGSGPDDADDADLKFGAGSLYFFVCRMVFFRHFRIWTDWIDLFFFSAARTETLDGLEDFIYSQFHYGFSSTQKK